MESRCVVNFISNYLLVACEENPRCATFVLSVEFMFLTEFDRLNRSNESRRISEDRCQASDRISLCRWDVLVGCWCWWDVLVGCWCWWDVLVGFCFIASGSLHCCHVHLHALWLPAKKRVSLKCSCTKTASVSPIVYIGCAYYRLNQSNIYWQLIVYWLLTIVYWQLIVSFVVY